MSLEIEKGLGILISMDEANTLNNAFQRLWRNANARQKKELDPVMEGWVTDFNRWRSSYLARATEWGKLSGWQKKYQALRDKFAAQGTKITAPVIVPTQKPGDITVETPDIPDPQDIGEEVQTAILVGVAALLAGGAILYFTTRK